MSLSGSEGCLRDIFWGYTNLMIARPQIDLGENLGALEMVHQVIDEGEEVPISDRDLVRCAIVDAEPLGSILFLDKQDWRAVW